ncbi:uncharacterized protein [Anas acuta]|uniref:uncharacterized protein n=1 Tax=Anas acuta TaxID=28680 RepID=UPI0035C90C54
MAGGLGPRLLALALALGPAGVWAQPRVVESGGGLRAPGDSVLLSCQGYALTLINYYFWWYRQAPSGRLECLSYISYDSSDIHYLPGIKGVWAQWKLVESGGGLQAGGNSVHLSCQGSGFNFRSYHVLWYRQAPFGRIEWVSFINAFGVWAELKLMESGGGLRAPGDSVHLSCQGSGFSFEDYYDVLWYRQAPGGSLEWVSFISYDDSTVEYGKAVKGRASVSRDNSQSKSSLSLSSLVPQDSAQYFCAVRTGTGNPAAL